MEKESNNIQQNHSCSINWKEMMVQAMKEEPNQPEDVSTEPYALFYDNTNEFAVQAGSKSKTSSTSEVVEKTFLEILDSSIEQFLE